MIFVADGYSDCGKVREHNEDSFRVDSDLGVFVVADGMGGHAAGEVASAMAVDTLFATFSRTKADPVGIDEATLQESIAAANQAIFTDAQAHSERKGMGTTLTAVVWDGERFLIGHVGDSRAYRLKGDVLEQLTRDHTWVNMQVRAGVLSEDEARNARFRHVLVKALGTQEEIEADVIPVTVLPKDRYLLCSDGLSDLVQHEDLKRLLAAGGDPGTIAKRLVELANALGGRDNITALVIDCYAARWKSTLSSAVHKLRR